MNENEMSLEAFINFCTGAEIIEEGSLEIAEESVSIDAFKVYVSSDYKKLRKTFKEGKKAFRKKDYDEAIAKIKECKVIIADLHKRVATMKDYKGAFGNFMSSFNPLLLFINNQKYTGYNTYTRYVDKDSKAANNEVIVQVLEALNLFDNECDELLAKIEKGKQQSTLESFTDIEDFFSHGEFAAMESCLLIEEEM